MSKIRTLNQLQDALDLEMGWRVKEIKVFVVASKGNGIEKKFFIRAGIALVYAHWEGFIKNVSEKYLKFVHNRGLTYRELKSCFAVFGLKARLQMLSGSRQATPNIEAFDFILSGMGQTAHVGMSSAINTESNLTSKVFTNIAESLDINVDKYSTRFNLIDESLVNRRNKIAHGEYMDLSGREFSDLVDEMLDLMSIYKTDILNAASTESYKRLVPIAS